MRSHIRHSTPVGIVITLGILFVVGSLAAEDPAEKNAARDSVIELADKHMRRCEMHLADETQTLVERIDHPLLVFGDAARNNANGTLWAFGPTGRPHAFLELYQGATANAALCHAVTLTGNSRIVMKGPEGQKWQPSKIQIEPIPIADAPPPEEKETARLRQLKEQARRFTAHQFWDPGNSRFELRLLVRPVHRYEDAAAGIQDGAAFVFANGTNPEVVLLIEAIGKKMTSSRWHYSLARMGSAEFHVNLDGKEVWTQNRTPGVVGSPDDPYWLFLSDSLKFDLPNK